VTALSLGPTPARRAVLSRRVRLFVAATITYNVLEAVIALSAGAAASSSALLGFGLDSVIEVSSAAVVAWQFAGRDPEAREKTALRAIACSFFALAAVSLAVMPGLSWGQRRAGRELGSASAVADSKQTLLCTYLSAVLLLGLAANAWFGWSWADPVAALGIAGIAAREGLDAWRGDTCCAPNALRPEAPAGAGDPSSSCTSCGPGCDCCTG